MKLALKIVTVLFTCVILAVAGLYLWASMASSRVLARIFEVHAAEFPVPFPLSDAERTESGRTGQEAQRLAMQRAIERGKHLVEARYGCSECHGRDFSGGVMVDAAPLGRLLGPNLTSGRGSRTVGYGAADWDRIVRHGLRPDGRPAVMPSEDFQGMSDQELSDIIAYVRSLPPVDNEVPPVALGPLGKWLVATGKLPLSADLIGSHDVSHVAYPPPPGVSIEFGRHLAGVCTGCHRQDLAGGRIISGDPSWPPARNLTPDSSGLADWSYAQFVAAMREGTRPDGTRLQIPMTFVLPYAQRMTDVEMRALWLYLRSVPAVARAH